MSDEPRDLEPIDDEDLEEISLEDVPLEDAPPEAAPPDAPLAEEPSVAQSSGEVAVGDAADAAEVFGGYTLIRPLGKGGMAEVFLARRAVEDTPEDEPTELALKRILPHHAEDASFVQMLHDEAQIASAIHHPHVARVYDQGEVDGLHYIAMEYVDGVDLSDVLRTLRQRGKAMSLATALYVARCVADALHAAHVQEGEDGSPLHIIHRDVSPHNILVGRDGAVKLTDFGVAKASHNQAATRSGVIKGKLQYMSPEQAMAKGLDARSDVFSLGLSLYKMLTGRLPFRGQNEFQVYEQILRKQATPPSKLVPAIPPRVDAIVMRALRKDPNGRFQSAKEMSQLLAVALKELSPDFTPRHLARFLAKEAPPKGIVVARDGEDDDLQSGELSAATSIPEEALDPRIDLLTRLSNGTGSLDLADGGGPMARKRRPLALWLAAVVCLVAVGGVAFWLGSNGGGRQASDGAKVASVAPEQPLLAQQPPDARATSPAVGASPSPSVVDASVPDAAPPEPDAAVAQRPEPLPDGGTAAEPANKVEQPSSAVAETPSPKGVASVKRKPPRRRRVVRKPPADTAGKPGFLSVNTLPWSWVTVDGKSLKKSTPVMRLPLKPGKHRILLKTADGRSQVKTVTIHSGKVSTLRHSF